MSKKTSMTPKAAARVQSAGAKTTSGTTPKGSFAARAQSAAAKNTSPDGGTKGKGK